MPATVSSSAAGSPTWLISADISAGGEAVAAGDQLHHRAAAVIGGEGVRRGDHALPHRQRNGVALLRLVEGQPANAVVAARQDLVGGQADCGSAIHVDASFN